MTRKQLCYYKIMFLDTCRYRSYLYYISAARSRPSLIFNRGFCCLSGISQKEINVYLLGVVLELMLMEISWHSECAEHRFCTFVECLWDLWIYWNLPVVLVRCLLKAESPQILSQQNVPVEMENTLDIQCFTCCMKWMNYNLWKEKSKHSV